MSEAALRERVMQLESVIGIDTSLKGQLRHALDIEPPIAELCGMLLRREFVTRDGAYTVLFGNRPECDMPEEQILDVYISNLRKALGREQIGFETSPGAGWRMPKADQNKLRAVLERAERPDLERVALATDQRNRRNADAVAVHSDAVVIRLSRRRMAEIGAKGGKAGWGKLTASQRTKRSQKMNKAKRRMFRQKTRQRKATHKARLK